MKKLTPLFALLIAACSTGSKAETSAQPVEEPAAEIAEQPETSPESQPKMQSMMAKMCPMHVDGTTMTMEPSEDAMVMVFTNSADAEEVQRRARMMAEHHTNMAGQHHDDEMPAFSVTAEDTDDGARLRMKPSDPGDLAKMKEMMEKRHASQEGDAKCPMHMMGMTGDGPHAMSGPKGGHGHSHGQ